MNPYILFVPFVIMAGIIVYLLKAKKRLEEENAEKKPPEKVEQSPVESIPESNAESVADLREQLCQFHQAMAQCPSSIIITYLDGFS